MSGKHSRTKGAGGERELAKLLGLGRNARNGLAAGDLACPEGYPFSIEVKRRSKAYTHLYKCIEQAEGYDEPYIIPDGTIEPNAIYVMTGNAMKWQKPRTPIAIVRDDRSEWLLVMKLSDALEIVPGLRVKEEA